MSYFYLFIAAVPSIILHEISHGYVAYLCGDPTAKNAKRLTLNPFRHIDPFGTVILPIVLAASGLPAFGYAKPVPVNITRLRKPRTQSLYVSLAGPATNIVLSALAFVYCRYELHHLQYVADTQGYQFVSFSAFFNFALDFGLVNLTLAVFNLIPIPPLDGSAIIERLVPQRHLGRYYAFRNQALPIVMVLFILNAVVFHVGGNWLSSLDNWWINLAQR